MSKESPTVRAKKPKKEYELFYLVRERSPFTAVYEDRGAYNGKFTYPSYGAAWKRAQEFLSPRPNIYAILITSNCGTSIVIKRDRLLAK